MLESLTEGDEGVRVGFCSLWFCHAHPHNSNPRYSFKIISALCKVISTQQQSRCCWLKYKIIRWMQLNEATQHNSHNLLKHNATHTIRVSQHSLSIKQVDRAYPWMCPCCVCRRFVCSSVQVNWFCFSGRKSEQTKKQRNEGSAAAKLNFVGHYFLSIFGTGELFLAKRCQKLTNTILESNDWFNCMIISSRPPPPPPLKNYEKRFW